MVSFSDFKGLLQLFVRDVSLEYESGGYENGSNGSLEGNGSGHSNVHEYHTNSKTVLFLFGSFAIGALVRHVLKHTPIPYTVILIVLGLAVGAASKVGDTFNVLYDFTALARIDPHLMLYIFLPTLLFESAFDMDVHTFKKTIGQTLILAGPGLIASTFLTALLAKFVLPYNWSWVTALVLGCILSATDPVAVVAVLHEIGTSKQLGTVIEGESLLNDGAAIVLFNVLLFELIPNQTQTALQIFVYFIRVTIGGPVLGYVIAKITIFWLSVVFNDALVEITITLASAYITYYIGEGLLGVSGVLAVVTLGIEINSMRTNISPEVDVFLHRFWGMLSYLANTLIFILVGVVIAQQAFSGVEGRDWVFLVVLYVGIMVIRFVVIAVLSPLLVHIGYSITWKQVIVITWGGLRGAVGLALALVLFQTTEIPLETIGSKVLFHTAGIVVLTLVINASTITTLLNVLGMSDISVVRRLTMRTAVRRINDAKHRAMRMLKSDRFLADAHWKIVNEKTVIKIPHKFYEDSAQAYLSMELPGGQSQGCTCETNIPIISNSQELAQLAEEVRLRMIKAEKSSFWTQYEYGMLGKQPVLILTNLADVAMDTQSSMISVEDVKAYWKIPFYLKKTRDIIYKAIQWKLGKPPPIPTVKCCLLPYKLVTHPVFDWTFSLIILLNVISTIVELSLSNDPLGVRVLEVFNYVFCFIYFVEVILKLIGLRHHYFLSKWNIFDFIIFLFSVIDVIVELSLPEELKIFTVSPSIFRVIKVLRILRIGRVFRLIRPAMPLLLYLVNIVINRKLRIGYDIGKGFVVGIEEMLQQFDRIASIAPQSVSQEFHRRAEDSRLNVIVSLGLLRKEHPGVALSVKTNHAIRSILNHCRDTVRHLLASGVLDEPDTEMLLKNIEVKVKHLQQTSATLPLPKPNAILLNMPWLSGSEPEAVTTIQACAVLEHFERNEVLIQNGKRPRGLFIIVSGLVKILTYPVTTTKSPDPSSDNGLHGDGEASSSMPPEENHERLISTDYVGTGSVMGEAAVLEHCISNKTVECETDGQVFFISQEDLKEIMTLYPLLEDQLWRVHGVQTARVLLSQLPEYLDWSTSKILLLCEGAFITSLPTQPTRSFEITGDCKEVVLVHGEIYSVDTREKLVAPMVVPRNIKNVVFDTGRPRLLLIPDIQKETPSDIDSEDLLVYQKKRSLLEKIKRVSQWVWRIKLWMCVGVQEVIQSCLCTVKPEHDRISDSVAVPIEIQSPSREYLL